MKFVFKNMERSEFIERKVSNKIESFQEKFPSLKLSEIICTIKASKSSPQKTSEKFRVKLKINTGKYSGLILEKTSNLFHKALTEVTDGIHERLRRFDGKKLKQKRQLASLKTLNS